MTLTVSDMAVIRDIAKSINALVEQRAALIHAKLMSGAQCELFDSQIDEQYQKLFALLPTGAENDQALLDLLLATDDDVFWTDVTRDEITAADVDHWCDELIRGEGGKGDIAKLRLQFFFGGSNAFNVYFAKHVALTEVSNAE